MGVKSIMIVGVGGQGTLLASKLLGNALLSRGFDVKVSEVHGMSQRGGSVVTYVRWGENEKVYSPVIEKGEADVIVSFEQLEAARWLPYLKKGGKMVVNTQCMDPMPVITGAAKYPEGLLDRLEEAGVDVTAIDALSLAKEAGSEKAVNVVLMGVMARSLDIDYDHWQETIRQTVPAKFTDMNLKAFDLGYQL
ncbi:indolepyruvate oxidoreductase subunit beta [Solibaculum mannosilyticum]|uniref:Indolepyruvate oxidoreductase n=1 Tax=Solibaculum mannosilyticum TaxID=2780922 RepID=A0A7I8D796_9FIRM|nr:indolepyruvate oxidoreductase subunit beta [Solibaculum mannosilyticum]MCO7136743.1 indolepyruvate oxidoreductase subunit beta [[Clostridium] leptum]BCI60494.1 indolepyruvate oxidoreductase [Solibaculum mannosilyticum]CZT57045.1 indolepyruvate oxidoreductase subunit beta [Eubacteriaceae bacterium CHKCI005]